jgi:WD40 repeat protein
MLALIQLLTRLLQDSEGKSTTEIQKALHDLQNAFNRLDTLFKTAKDAINPAYITSKKQRVFFSHFLQYNHPKLTKANQTLTEILKDSASGKIVNPANLATPSHIVSKLHDRLTKKLNEMNNATGTQDKDSHATVTDYLKQFIDCLATPLPCFTPIIPNDIDEQFSASLQALQPQIEMARQKLTTKGREKYSCFLSYAWGNPEHEHIVALIAKQLEQAGINVLFDRWEDVPGRQIQHFVSKIDTANWIILFGSQLYKQKYDKRVTDQTHPEHVVKTEAQIMNAIAMHSNKRQQKIIPVLLEGNNETSLPQPFFKGQIPIDLGEGDYIAHIERLIKTLYKISPKHTHESEVMPASRVAASSSTANSADTDTVPTDVDADPHYLHHLLESDPTPEAFEALLTNLERARLKELLQTQDKAGNTPLHIALQSQAHHIQDILIRQINSLENAASCYTQTNHEGQTPQSLARPQHTSEPNSSAAQAAASSSQSQLNTLKDINMSSGSTINAGNTSNIGIQYIQNHTTNQQSPRCNTPPSPFQEPNETAKAARAYNLVACLHKHYKAQRKIQRDTPILKALKNYYIEQQCSLDIAGTTPKIMADHIMTWLHKPSPPTLLILGEAGGGKSLLTQDWEQRLWTILNPELHLVPPEQSREAYVRSRKVTSALLYHQQQWWLSYQQGEKITQINACSLPPYPFVQLLLDQSYQSLQMDPMQHKEINQGIQYYWLCQQKSYLPIRIPLGDYNAEAVLKCVEKHLETVFRHECLEFEQNDLFALRNAVRFLCLFDAYDEIRSTEDQFEQNLYLSNDLQHNNAKALFTCRSQYYDNLDRSNLCFNSSNTEVAPKVYLTQFKLTNIQAYIEHYATVNHLENKATILASLTENAYLQELLATPLLLNLYMESYAPGKQPRNRWELYQRLMHGLFERQSFKSNGSCSIKTLKLEYEDASAELAFTLYVENLDVIAKPTQLSQRRQKRRASSTQTETPLASFFSEEAIQTQLRCGHPFKLTATGKYGFIHESFKEFFIAKYLLADLEDAVEFESAQDTWNAKLLPKKPVILRFLREAIEAQVTEAQLALKTQLWRWVTLKTSKYSNCSANSASLLTQLGQSFSNQDLSGTYLMGANLSGGMLDSTNFTQANCSGVNFSQAWLRSANFTRADLSNTEWGEYPRHKLIGKVKAIHSDATGITQIATTDTYCTIYLWDGVTGEQLARLDAHTDFIRCLSYSPDGAQLACGSDDSRIQLWNLARRCQEASLKGHTGNVSCLSYSPDGAQLASGSNDCTIRLWNLARRCQEASLKGHTDDISCLSYSPDGTQLASGSKDSTIQLWNLARRLQEASLKGHTGGVFCLSYSPDGAQLASGSYDNTIQLWNLARRCQESSLDGHTNTVWCLSYSPDGAQLASGSTDRTIRLWNLARRCQEASLKGHTDNISRLNYSPDGTQLTSGSDDSTIRRWNLARRCQEASLHGHTGIVLCLSYSPGGLQLASGSNDRTIRLWNLARRCQEDSLKKHTGSVWSLSYSPDGTQLASGSDDSTIRLWNLARRCQEDSLDGHSRAVQCLSYSPDGAQLASASYDSTIRLWNLARRCEEDSLDGHTDDVNCLSYSPDGAQLASGSEDCTIQLWNLARRCEEVSLKGHTRAVQCLSYSPDGAQLASGSNDKTLRIWDLVNSVCLRLLSLHMPVWALAWHTEFLALGCYEKIVHLRTPQGSKPEDWYVEWRAVRNRVLFCNDLTLSGAICDSITKRLLIQYGAAEASDDLATFVSPEASSSTTPSSDNG